VQSLSFSPQGRSLDWRKLHELTRAGVRVGLHVTLVGEPWCTDGRVVPGWKQLVRYVLTGGRAARDAVSREVDWQLRQCLDHGIDVAHIDSHQHVHAFPGIWQPVLRAARDHHIPRVRVPWCPSSRLIKKNVGGLALQALSRQLGSRVRAAGVAYLPILGVANAGHNTVEVFEREFAHVTDIDVELCVHPGVNTPELEAQYADWKFDWTGERDALLSRRFAQTLAQRGYSFARPLTSHATSAVA
jgi:predicted glycoside hydrolase/deacetylase ChbG (UPF0249 family)